jgi:hypothetical protein
MTPSWPAATTFGLLEVTQSFLPYLRQAAAARILNVSSGYGQSSPRLGWNCFACQTARVAHRIGHSVQVRKKRWCHVVVATCAIMASKADFKDLRHAPRLPPFKDRRKATSSLQL